MRNASNWKKSALEAQLETEGYEFLTNEEAIRSVNIFQKNGLVSTWRGEPISREDIRQKYLLRGFADLRVEDAYDRTAQLLPRSVGIYVKRKA